MVCVIEIDVTIQKIQTYTDIFVFLLQSFHYPNLESAR